MKSKISTSAGLFRLLARDAVRNRIEDQVARGKAVAGDRRVVVFDAAKERDDWYRLARPHDTLWVDAIELIPGLRARGVIPTADLAEVQAAIGAARLRLLIGADGIEPTPKHWREATHNVARGRRITRAQQSKGGKTRAAQLQRTSVVQYWRDHPEHETFAAIWKSNLHPNSEIAREAVNIAASRKNYQTLGSIKSCERAFGDRGIRAKKRE